MNWNDIISVFGYKRYKDRPANKPWPELAGLDSKAEKAYRQWRSMRVDPMLAEDRLYRYDEMDDMYFNSPFVSRAVEMEKDNTLSAETTPRIITPQSENEKLLSEITDFFDAVGMDEVVTSVTDNLIRFGDAFVAIVYGENGVTDVPVIDPRDVQERVEFSPIEVSKQLQNYGNPFFKTISNDAKIKAFLDGLSDGYDDYSTYFKTYLIGFVVSNFFLPPWRCVHFRDLATSDAFYPYGTPSYIHALYPYKQLDFGMTMQGLLRRANFPTEIVSVVMERQGMSFTEAAEYILRVRQEMENMGVSDTRKEDVALGERLYLPQDLISFDSNSPGIDLSDIEDLEMLRDDVVVAMGIPRSLVDPHSGVFGDSGVAFIEQFKPFARKVFKKQREIMAKVETITKLHLIAKGYALDEIDGKFYLEMEFPYSQLSSDSISNQKDLLDLAGTIIDDFRERLFGDEDIPLPVEVVKKIYKEFLPYENEFVDDILADYIKAKGLADNDLPQGDVGVGSDFRFAESRNKIEKIKRASPDGYRKLLAASTSQAIYKKRYSGLLSGKNVFLRRGGDDFDFKRYVAARDQGQALRLNEEYEVDFNESRDRKSYRRGTWYKKRKRKKTKK